VQGIERTSLWYRDLPKRRDRLLNIISGLTKFTQSDFTTLTEGNVKIISACLNPIERSLFIPKGLLKGRGDGLIKFIVELSIEFIKRVRQVNRNYFEDLEAEYEFYKREEKNQDPACPNQFKLSKNFSDIEKNLNNPEKNIISVFFSIEGCHVFNNGGLESSSWPLKDVIENIETVKKKWDHPPLYVSIAHHMNNDLCGHAKSLPSLISRFIDQKKGMNKGFMGFGEEVLHKLLEKDPCRIYIDIKHMSVKSRLQYYEILDSKYGDEPVPIIVSHGAVNGLKSIEPEKDEKFNTEDINFFDDEIIKIHCSGGFLGIQLDERRLCPITKKRSDRWRINRAKRLECHSEFVWNQIDHIAKVLDDKGLFGWGTATIGSDNDGLVDTLNGYWTSEEFSILEAHLIRHAHNFLNTNPPPSFHNPKNAGLSACEIIDLFMRGNAQRFLKKFYQDNVRITGNQEKDTLCKEVS